MKRRRFISFVFVLILCFGMSGCGKEKKTTAPNKFQSDYMEVWGGTTVEEGDFRVINGLLYYIDFETMEGIPICNKPNCRHIWYGYISWEDLLAGKNNIKTLVETKFTGGGKPLDEEGNVIGE